jgi:tetratricopeptide (TPR) repeat protein
VRAVFSWSAGQLGPRAARLFRLLGLHPGPDLTAPAAASLAGIRESEAHILLAELTRAHLIGEHLPGRYAFHDLLRAYAAEQARATEDEEQRRAAAGRILDHYLYTAHSAAIRINPSRDPITLPAPRPGVTLEHLPSHQRAMVTLQAEHQVLLAAITLADSSGFDVHAWQIPWALADFLHWWGRWHEKAAIQGIALAAAERLGDTAGRAVSLRLLAHACSHLEDHDQALTHYAACLNLYQQLGDRLGEAKVYQLLGVATNNKGDYADGLSHAKQALRLYQAIGYRSGEAKALNNIGWTHALLGDYQQARVACQRSVTLAADLGLRDVEGIAWQSAGYAEHCLGNLAEAAACYQRARSLIREFGHPTQEAAILNNLGDTWHVAGDLSQAWDTWQQALDILDDLHHRDADEVRAKLAGIGGQVASGSADSAAPAC